MPTSNFHDLGSCGHRADLSGRTELCGAFRVPSLRNVAKTAPVLPQRRNQDPERRRPFYVRQGHPPEEWWPPRMRPATVPGFNDLRPYRANVNVTGRPQPKRW